MNIHEYQARQILRDYGISVPPGEVATSADEVLEAAKRLGGAVVVKAIFLRPYFLFFYDHDFF